MARFPTAARFAGMVVLFTSLLVLLATTLHHTFASSRENEMIQPLSKRSSTNENLASERSYPIKIARPYNYFPRQAAPFQNSSTPITSTSSSTPTVPFGVFVTTIDGAPYTLTYVSTTATADTSIVESDATTTTTEDITAGAPIWGIPTLPPGFPPIPPPPPPPGAHAAAAGAVGCIFGCGGSGPGGIPCVVDCGGGDNPTGDSTDNPTDSSTDTSSQTTTSSDSSSTTSTTSSTTTSSSSEQGRCEYGCTACGFARRAESTAEASYDRESFNKMLKFARDNSVHIGKSERSLNSDEANDLPKLMEKRSIPIKKSIPANSKQLLERGIPLAGEADGTADLYSNVENSGGTVKVELTGGFGGGTPSSQLVTWDQNDQNILVTGLEGCTSVLIVSQKAGYASHFWETPAFTFTDANAFQSGVLDFLQSSLGSAGDLFSSDTNPKIYIMTPADKSQTIQAGDMSDGTLSESLTPDSEFSDKISQIAGALGSLVPGASVDYFYYARQRNDIKLNGAYGKAFISYSGKQTTNPDDVYDMNDLNPPISVWQAWTQGKMIGEDRWAGVGCTGNQKRQDGGSCEVTTTSSSTLTSSSTTSSSPTTTTTSSTSTSSTTTTSTTATSSSSAPPPPSCSTATANGAVCTLCSGSVDPACTPIGPPTPSQTSSNNKGSALCKSAISGDACKAAYGRYDDNRIYTAYTSYTFTDSDSDINYWLAPFANDGCTAMFTCDDDEAYATGMAGWQIKQAFDNLYANDDVNTCGSSYLSNRCHVTVNGCQDCKDVNI